MNIKVETWSIRTFIEKIESGYLEKPKFQRQKRWTSLPVKDNHSKRIPNNKNYIEFLYRNGNSIEPISFSNNMNKFINIDGNNRINAVYEFLLNPYELFSEYYEDLFKFINDEKNEIKFEAAKYLINDYFKKLSYNSIMNFKYKDNEYCKNYLKPHSDKLDDIIDELQNKFKINGSVDFRDRVSLNIIIYNNYSTSELTTVFEDINSYKNVLTEVQLLAASLFDITVDIKDETLKNELKLILINHYKTIAKNECLPCHSFQMDDNINGYDFIISFQIYSSKLCSLIQSLDLTKKGKSCGKSLFNKLYESLFGCIINNLNETNVDLFIDDINYSIEILNNCLSIKTKSIAMNINDNCILLTLIISLKRREITKKKVISIINKALVIYDLIKFIDDKDDKKYYQYNYNCLKVSGGGGALVNNYLSKIIINPEKIIEDKTIDINDIIEKIEDNDKYLKYLKNLNIKSSEQLIMNLK
jgi:hypothetical protein